MISTSNITLRIGKKALFEDVNIKDVYKRQLCKCS